MDLMIKVADAAADFDDIYSLWHEAFGDDEDYVRDFFTAFDPRGRLLLGVTDGESVSDGECVSFVCLIPIKMRADGETYSGSYIYAACVRASLRGRGIFRIFSDMCADYIKDTLRDDFAFLVPSSQSLFSMYRKLGFTFTADGLLPLCHDMPPPVPTELFGELRRRNFDGDVRRLYDFYLRSEENRKLILDYDLFAASLRDHIDSGGVEYLCNYGENDENDICGYVIYGAILQNGKKNINIYDIYFYGSNNGDIIYEVKKYLRTNRIREKALWRSFAENLTDASRGEVFLADILFEG
jgi:Acetyltransferases